MVLVLRLVIMEEVLWVADCRTSMYPLCESSAPLGFPEQGCVVCFAEEPCSAGLQPSKGCRL